jgi:hypothetical protein
MDLDYRARVIAGSYILPVDVQNSNNPNMQQMDVDIDVPAFLNKEKQSAPANLQNYYLEFEDLYDRK